MKKYNSIIALVALAVMSSCNSDILDELLPESSKSNAIEFENILTNNSTRTSITGSNFKANSAMEVYGFQTTNGEVDQIFNDQTVNYNGGTKWSYSPIKYWNPQSSYKFYAAYPAGDYAFDTTSKNFTITDFTVADAIADQEDLMIAEENSTTPGNAVTLNFNHILAQVNFYAKLSSNLTGVKSGKINNLKVTGLKNMGTFEQTGFDATTNNVTGEWTSNNGEYLFPAVSATPVAYSYVNGGEMTTDNGNVVRDLLMVPQALEAVLFVDYTLTYDDNTTSRFTKEIPLQSIKFNNSPVDSWLKNTIYNYIMVLDPSRVSHDGYTDVAIDYDGSDGGGDGVKDPDAEIVGPDANGDYYVDTDGDGTGDVPIVWEDIDGDGNLEGGIDADGDGHIDDVDNSTDSNTSTNPEVTDGDPTNNPEGKDVILVDTDGDGVPDTQLEQTTETEVGPKNPTQYGIDYDGTINGDAQVTPDSRLTQDSDGNYYVEVYTDGDGTYETSYPVQWADLDGDGKEEAYVGDIDGENNNPSGNPLVTDGNSNNPNGYDAILVDTDGDGTCDTQLERTTTVVISPDPTVSNAIIFSAQVEDWEKSVDPEINVNK